LLFPGQASQAVGMGVELRQASARARAIFELADRLTGLPITRLAEEGPLEDLTATEVAQPALVATSLAALAVLREKLPGDWAPGAVAGHSVGELAAYVAAGALDEEEALRLVHVRAQAMAAACAKVDGTMLGVLGLDAELLQAICEAASGGDGSVELANLNAPGQLIVSGARGAVARAAEQARAAGARRAMPLQVGGPFHSVYMQSAAAPLEAALEQTPPRPARVPVIANVLADPIQRPEDLARELSTQVYSTVRWSDSLRRLSAMGCERFLEVGPGTVIAGLVKRTLPSARVASFGALSDLDGARSLLGQ
jgi:[acyl-carrier-protein] S-malonyltransferase